MFYVLFAYFLQMIKDCMKKVVAVNLHQSVQVSIKGTKKGAKKRMETHHLMLLQNLIFSLCVSNEFFVGKFDGSCSIYLLCFQNNEVSTYHWQLSNP